MSTIKKNKKDSIDTRDLQAQVNSKNIQELDKDYKNYISYLAARHENIVFYNSSPQHATFVMTNIFELAKKEVNIFNGGFTGAVSSDPVYLSSLLSFIGTGGILRILCSNESIKSKTVLMFLEFINSRYPNSVKVRSTPIKLKEKNQKIENNHNLEDKEIHFTVADETMYRVETDIDRYFAYCNFNDPVKSKVLTEYFNKLFDDPNSQEILLKEFPRD